MQETRRQILEILRDRGEATVDQIVQDLTQQRGSSITAVTVRHHLTKLQDEGFVTMPQMERRSSPGRPRHVYALTDSGETFFPNNYQQLSKNLLDMIEQTLPSEQVNVIIEGVADTMANTADVPDGPLPDRLDSVVEYLTTHGYEASWRYDDAGFILKTSNCPYHNVAHDTDLLCQMDMRLISTMLGIVPRMTSRVSDGDEVCAYLIPFKQGDTVSEE